MPAADHTTTQIDFERNPDRHRRLVIVGHRPQRAADPRVLEEQCQRRDQRPRHDRGDQVELIDQHIAEKDRVLRDADVQRVDVAAPDLLAEPVEEERYADGGHEQVICSWLTSGRSTRRSTSIGQRHHDGDGQQHGEPDRHAQFDQADEAQCREQHHRALRVVEHAGRLVDQHEAQRDQRIHHAREQSAHGDLDDEGKVHRLSAPRRDRPRSPRDRAAPRPAFRRRSCGRSRAPRHGRRCPSPRSCRARSARSWCRTRRSRQG